MPRCLGSSHPVSIPRSFTAVTAPFGHSPLTVASGASWSCGCSQQPGLAPPTRRLQRLLRRKASGRRAGASQSSCHSSCSSQSSNSSRHQFLTSSSIMRAASSHYPHPNPHPNPNPNPSPNPNPNPNPPATAGLPWCVLTGRPHAPSAPAQSTS